MSIWRLAGVVVLCATAQFGSLPAAAITLQESAAAALTYRPDLERAGALLAAADAAVDAALADHLEALFAGLGMREDVAAPLHGLFDQADQARIVIDVEDMRRAVRHQLFGLGDLHHGEEQAKLLDGVGKAVIVDRLGDIDIGAQIVAALDLALVIGGGEHNDR